MYKEKLKSIRENKKVKQKELATLLDIVESGYARYENELDTIPTKHLNTICNYFNVSFDYIFNLTSKPNYTNTNKDIDLILAGKRLKEFRKENNLTQVKLASILNTVHPTIVNYEKGKHLIATPFLFTICSKYKISADYLLGKTNEPKFF